MTTVIYQDPQNPGEVFSLEYLTDFNDTWIGFIGTWNIYGGDGHDSLTSGGGNDVLAGGNGNDHVSGGAGRDRLFGDAGNDTLDGGSGRDVLFGGSGHDVLVGGGGFDEMDGGSGDDTFYTNAGFDFGNPMAIDVKFGIVDLGDADLDSGGIVDGGTGDDRVYVDVFFGGVLEIDGGSGRDRIDLGTSAWAFTEGIPSDLSTQFVNLSIGEGQTISGGQMTIAGIEDVLGSDYRDVLTGDGSDNDLRGRANNDVLEGLGGNDLLDGGSGTDTATYANATTGVHVDLTRDVQRKIAVIDGEGVFNGDAAEDRLISIENLIGSNHRDVLRGDAGRNVLDGADGNDILEGRGGNDVLRGGDGHDVASYESSVSGVHVALANSTPRLGDAQGDTLESIEGLYGSAFDDMLYGSIGANTLHGNGGNDYIYGWGSNDTIRGGGGSDKIYGGTGRDELWGDADADTFRFFEGDTTSSQIDVIKDFQKTQYQGGFAILGDSIDFSGIDTNPNALGNQGFTMVGNGGALTEDKIRITSALDADGRFYNVVESDWTGDGQADLTLHVYTTTNQALTTADFIW